MAEIQSVCDAYFECYVAGDVGGRVRYYSKGGAIHSPYAPAAVGWEALRNTNEDWFAANKTNKRVTATEAYGIADLASCMTRYSGNFTQEDGRLDIFGDTSMNVLARGAGGVWKVKISSVNSDTAPLAE